jgi:hypothetical protein
VSRYTIDLDENEAADLREWIGPGKLRKKAERGRRENADYAETMLRMVRAMERRAGGDPDLLPALKALQDEVRAAMGRAVEGCRRDGYSWEEIGSRLGTSRQSAQITYGKRASKPL